MEAVRELEAAFQKEGLNLPPSLIPSIDEAAHGMTEGKARFAVYQAMAKQMLHVEQVIPFQPNVVLVYPSALLECIAVGSMEWRTSGH
ncbi:hypothetical protein RvY_18170 [Ramazzottius varieornatus]|uniref:Uncharacterized protein n=1 Tax=Ramazzottius varieornatus TaxID=947166 RepID=A0A1D1W885_RAMVA|nr:hypothetical protein RvY_18170 [Ramazzottius varieornatus]